MQLCLQVQCSQYLSSTSGPSSSSLGARGPTPFEKRSTWVGTIVQRPSLK